MQGYEVIKKLKASEPTANIPVIFLTVRIDPESEVKGLDLGGVDYITKPFSRDLLLKRIGMHLLVEKQKRQLLDYSVNLEKEVERKTRTVFELQHVILKTVAELVESRDNITGRHIERTQHYLNLLVGFLAGHDAYTAEISTWNIELLVMSSLLHDVGKIAIRDDILMKPGRLTAAEFAEVKKHTVYGMDIISRIEEQTTESAFLHYAKILAGFHHEQWNGKGYPHGLRGRDIPLPGRLMAIVDVYDALTSARPYKRALTYEKAVETIKSGLGTHFDPLLGEIFLAHEKEFRSYSQQAGAIAGAANFSAGI
jgi:putative two-component system response regulator